MGVGPLRRPLGGIGRKNRNSPPHLRENTAISRKVSTFSTSDREQNVFASSFTLLISPFESTLVNWEVMSSILAYAGIKIFVFLGKF